MTSTPDQQEFMRLFHEAERDLFRYLVVLVSNEADASDVLQETAVAIWKKFDQFDAAYPFIVWARKFAYMEAARFRTDRRREGAKRNMLSDELIEQFGREYEEQAAVVELRISALEQCIGKLLAEDRELLEARYWKDKHVRSLAVERNVNEDRLYRRLHKVRQMLEACIQQTIATKEI